MFKHQLCLISSTDYKCSAVCVSLHIFFSVSCCTENMHNRLILQTSDSDSWPSYTSWNESTAFSLSSLEGLVKHKGKILLFSCVMAKKDLNLKTTSTCMKKQKHHEKFKRLSVMLFQQQRLCLKLQHYLHERGEKVLFL